MSTVATAPSEISYLTAKYTLRSWLTTTDHKRIALLYLGSITLFFFIGGAAATLIRLTLLRPDGSLVTADSYNRLFTMHGVVMVWFFLIPSIPTTIAQRSTMSNWLATKKLRLKPRPRSPLARRRSLRRRSCSKR